MKNNSFQKKTHWIFGTGLLQGLRVTLKNFIDSYFKGPDAGGVFTFQYPEERTKKFDTTRNFPFLVYDKDPANPRCVACGICERECPVKCIHIIMAKDAAGKPARKPTTFEIDYALCMNCGMCEEVCPFDSIFMDHTYEIASGDRNTFLKSLPELLKPNSYFQKIRPTDAAVIDAKIKTAEEKKRAAIKQTPPPAKGAQS